MSECEKEIDIFKVLSHPLRRKLLIFIANRRAASYKELLSVVSKPGALYHHLRLLGDLIEQDERRMYKLTEKGRRVYEFLISEFFVPEDRSIHRFLTPRPLLEVIEGRIAILLVAIYVVSCVVWFFFCDLLPVFILIAPAPHQPFLGMIIPIVNWLISTTIIRLVIRILYRRTTSFSDLALKLLPAFILVNLYPLLIVEKNIFLMGAIYVIIQFFALMLSISAVSVSARLPLRSSTASVITVHYVALVVVVVLILFASAP